LYFGGLRSRNFYFFLPGRGGHRWGDKIKLNCSLFKFIYINYFDCGILIYTSPHPSLPHPGKECCPIAILFVDLN